jgi:hypothetical protein
MNKDSHEQEDDIVNDISQSEDVVETPVVPTEEPVGDKPEDFEEEDEANLSNVDINPLEDTNAVKYDQDQIDLRGDSVGTLIELMANTELSVGPVELDSRVRTPGTWENIIYRNINDFSFEEERIQNAIALLKKSNNEELMSVLRNEDGKILLRTSPISYNTNPGSVTNLTGDAALLAFECQDTGSPSKTGGRKLPLYNSGISIDLITPTANDVQTLLVKCIALDKELGTSAGAHYFTYADILYKSAIVEFLQPLIIGCSYVDWQKNGRLWAAIKLPDLSAILMTVAAMIHPDGYDNFVTRCTRPTSDIHPDGCRHVETIKADLLSMIQTRFPVMSKTSVEHMVSTRKHSTSHTLPQIAKYQAGLGLEGERITFGNITFTMRIPSVAEHLEAGSQFISDIINEIGADNTGGQYEQLGFRYIRSFLPWIASVEKKKSNDSIVRTTEPTVIIRELEKLDFDDEEGNVRNDLRAYIDKCQLTYVGYPITQCASCGYTADTPSGMRTIDPFNSFFTMAFRLLTQKK